MPIRVVAEAAVRIRACY